MKKAGQTSIGTALIIGLAAMFFLVIIYFTFTGPFERIRDTFNATYTTDDERQVAQNVDNMWHYAFLILALTVIIFVILVALGHQPREYYL